MAKHRFHPTRYFNAIGVAEPCLRVADGDTVVTDTIDASGLDAREMPAASPSAGCRSDSVGRHVSVRTARSVSRVGAPDKRRSR